VIKTQNKITLYKQNMNNHFSSIASKYRSVRTLDIEPVLHIKNQINGKPKINMADIGCGDGRYSLEFLRQFGNKCYLHCIDYNENMIKSLRIISQNKTLQTFVQDRETPIECR
jgi:ubiquinone/menaquinone biosynthesis C-methylase UbiE